MYHPVIDLLLNFLLIYGAVGLIFAGLFLLRWIHHFDHAAQTGSWGFRLVIFPGLVALWPWLLSKVWASQHGRYTPPVADQPVSPRRLRATHGWAIISLAVIFPILALLALKHEPSREVIPFDSQLEAPAPSK